VRQVVYLLELYRQARSLEYKIFLYSVSFFHYFPQTIMAFTNSLDMCLVLESEEHSDQILVGKYCGCVPLAELKTR
jgi:hypothetical protein